MDILFPGYFLVCPRDLLGSRQGVCAKDIGNQVFPMHIDGSNLVISVCLIIVDSFCRIHAAGIGGDVIEFLGGDDASPDHGYGVQYMEKLGNAAHFVFFADGVQAEIGGFDETGSRGIIPGQADTAETLAEGDKAFDRAETVGRTAGSQVHVLAEVGGLETESGIIGQHPDRIFAYVHTGFCIFQHKGTCAVGDVPVQGR